TGAPDRSEFRASVKVDLPIRHLRILPNCICRWLVIEVNDRSYSNRSVLLCCRSQRRSLVVSSIDARVRTCAGRSATERQTSRYTRCCCTSLTASESSVRSRQCQGSTQNTLTTAYASTDGR